MGHHAEQAIEQALTCEAAAFDADRASRTPMAPP
jgi:hypothetical protein